MSEFRDFWPTLCFNGWHCYSPHRNHWRSKVSLAQPVTAPTTNEELPRDIVELMAAISSLPIDQRVSLAPLVDKVVESTRRRRRILNLVQDALGQLRLDMKYLIFDLEATRRERDELRAQNDRQAEDFE
jgi:hypothetical protein